MAREKFLTFPPDTLAPEPQRIPVLWNDPDAIILNKPSGVAAFGKRRIDETFVSIVTSINERAAPGTQFARCGIENVAAVNWLASEASGVLLFAKTDDAKTFLRNELGSQRFVFRYRFISAGNPESDELECHLPVARHRRKPQALISHKTGKKTVTKFRKIEELGKTAIWESESAYDRFHQIRLHAMESGIPIVNDPLYGEEVNADSQDMRKPFPFFLHLATLTFPWKNGLQTIEAPAPREFKRAIRKAERGSMNRLAGGEKRF